MSRMNRRQFTWIATGGLASATLVACSGEAVSDDLTPTQIPDVAGAPPTLAPQATPFESEEGEEATPVDEASPAAEEGATPVEEEAAAEEEPAATGGSGEAITLEAIDPYDWSMYEFEATPGQDITVINTGFLPHNFNVDEWGIATEDLNNGEEETVTVPDDAEAGAEVVFYCSVPGHREAGMEGTITVV